MGHLRCCSSSAHPSPLHLPVPQNRSHQGVNSFYFIYFLCVIVFVEHYVTLCLVMSGMCAGSVLLHNHVLWMILSHYKLYVYLISLLLFMLFFFVLNVLNLLRLSSHHIKFCSTKEVRLIDLSLLIHTNLNDPVCSKLNHYTSRQNFDRVFSFDNYCLFTFSF